ncbi:autotransporter outer membrane beta-barrel domain-containing protein [Stenotrophomonas sp. PD6]|uniref:autotransporter outer membrane beta-barrel domain-containing protein n=1 Tax=Stenotrophomonas sp. PD6 TaxID=3368612 RepID=UPI003BA1F604
MRRITDRSSAASRFSTPPARHLLSSAVAALLFGAVLLPVAHADGGKGGCVPTTGCTGSPGGTPDASDGDDGADSSNGSGGNGAGGGSVDATTGAGGNGGTGGDGAANGGGGGNGAAGQAGSGGAGQGGSVGGNGGNGGQNTGGTVESGAGGGGGGGGGVGTLLSGGATNTGIITGGAGGNGGGAGGNGGNGTGNGGSGGGGGEGGGGVLLTAPATFENTGQVIGGNGGNGGGAGSPNGTGDGSAVVAGEGGQGGAGGAGVLSTSGGTVINAGGARIVGGNGANGGGAGSATSTAPAGVITVGGWGGDAGVGGRGVFLSGGSIVQNLGEIVGGNGGNGENGGFGNGAGAVESGGGGVGGNGGEGAWIDGSGSLDNAFGGSIRGGDGGTGGGGSTLNSSGTNTITGGEGAAGGAGGVGVVLVGGGTVSNAGSITGGNGNRSGGGSNATGGGTAGDAGVGGDGIALNGGGSVTNTVSGVVQGGNGGNNSVGGGGVGGVGGNGISLNNGGDVGNAGQVRGGGGGAGANATTTDGDGGGGSDGGNGVLITGSGDVTNAAGASITGGDGNTGGGSSGTGIGGAGGGGGSGVLVTGGGNMRNDGAVTGGNGNRGGGGGGGVGGEGGAGVEVDNGGVLVNTGTVVGGNGGEGGTAGSGGGAGAGGGGGVGVIGENMQLVNSGSITGGLSGDGGTRADAILFIGGVNSLELQAGSAISGIVDGSAGDSTLILGGAADSAFDAGSIGDTAQYRGFAAFHKTGSSTWTLSGAANGVTPWTLYDGVLAIDAEAALGDPAGALTFDGGTLRLDAAFDPDASRDVVLDSGGGSIDTQAFTSTWGNTLTGDGALTKLGSGTLVLTGDNDYQGGTTVSAGTLQLGDGGTTGSIVGDIVDNGMLVFDRSDVLTVDGLISGSGSVSQIGDGTTVLTADNTYVGGTTISAGTLQLGDGGTTGSIVGDITDNGTLVFNRSSTFAVGGVISGSGDVIQEGAGTTVLTGTNTYTGGTTINDGTLQLGDGGSTGSVLGDIEDDGSLVFNRNNLLTVAGVISGSGTVTQMGSGTTALTGTNTYTGGTTISAGTLQLGNGGSTGSVVGDIADNGNLVFNRNNLFAIDGVISGSGTVAQVGSGTTVLNALNPYTGATIVGAGTLAVGDAAHRGARLAGGGPVSVAAAATFGGYGGTAGDVDNRGTLAVADAVTSFNGGGGGQFVVGGTLVNSGLAQVSGAAVGNRLVAGSYIGQSGRVALNTVLNGDGSASDRLVIDGGTAGGQSALLIANMGGRGATTPGNGILVVEALNGASSAAQAFALGNRAEAGPYLYTLYQGARDGSAPQSWYLRSQNTNPPTTTTPPPVVPPTGPAIDPVVPDYRPEVSLYTALPSVALNYGTSLIGTLHERVGEQEQLREPAPTTGWGGHGAWVRVLGQDGEWNAGRGGIYADGPTFDDDMFAVQAGTDLYRGGTDAGRRDFAGVTASTGRGHASVRNFDDTHAGTDRFDAVSLGAFWTTYAANNAYLDAVLQATWYDAKARSDHGAVLDTDGFGIALSLEGGYPFQLDSGWSLTPQAQMIYQSLRMDDAGDAVSSVHFDDADALTARAGARLSRDHALSGGTQPRMLTSWLVANLWHEFRSDARISFDSADGPVPFHSDLSGTWWELGVGVSAQLGARTSAYATAGYQKAFGEGVQALGASVGLRWNW